MIQHFGTPHDLPLRLYPTSACNFNCRTPYSTRFCDHDYLSERSPTVEEMVSIFKLFKHANLAKIVKISGREPTLFPNILSLIRILNPLTERITLSTNGTGSIELMSDIIRNGVSIITITIPSLDPEKFAFSIGLSHDVALEKYWNLLNLIEFLSEKKVKLHFVRIIIRDFNDSQQDIDSFLSFSRKYHALAKIFDLNYHNRMNEIYNLSDWLPQPAQAIWKNLYIDLTPLKMLWKKNAKEIKHYQNVFSPRVVYQLILEDGTELLFDEYRPFKRTSIICRDCPQKGFCREGPYANGWELRPDLQLQICPIRSDRLINFQNPEQIEKIYYSKSDIHVIRKNYC